MNDAQFCACLGANCGGDTIADSSGKYHTVFCGSCKRPDYCAGYASPLGGALGSCSPGAGVLLDPIQEGKAEIITSLAENGTPCKQYGYAQNIMDGRGITSGRAGFCTGTGDAITVIECYDTTTPGNKMQQYMPGLIGINGRFDATKGLMVFQNGSLGDLMGLDAAGYTSTWQSLGNDAAFRACQDAASDAIYEGASLRHVTSKGFTTALTKMAFWDAQVNQGEVNPVFGMNTMIALADKLTGPIGSPPSLADEAKWLGNFLSVRLRMMQNDPTLCNCGTGPQPCAGTSGTDQCTTDWKTDTGRMTAFQAILAAKNYDLSQPFTMEGTTITTLGNAAAADGKVCPP